MRCAAYGVIRVAGPGGVLEAALWVVVIGSILFGLWWYWRGPEERMGRVAILVWIVITFGLVIVGSVAILSRCSV